MAARPSSRWLLGAIVLVALVVAGTATVAATSTTEAALLPDCTVSASEVNPFETVTVDASASDSSSLDFDFEGDGTYDVNDTTEFVQDTFYADGGQTYNPVVRDSDGQTATCGSVYVNARPVGNFTASPDPGIAGQNVTFNATLSDDPDGEIVRYWWDFDGDELFDVNTTDPVVNHTYFETGSQSVILRVEDDDGVRDFFNKDVEIVEPNVVARCTATPTTSVVGQNVTLDARESENASSIAYDFDGDGTYELADSTDFRINHSYAEQGTYEPQVVVFGPTGQQDIAQCGTVTVEPENTPPEASFTFSPDPGMAGQPMTFDAADSTDPDGQIQRYEWDFDGDFEFERTTTDPQISETFFSSGFKNVGLRVVDTQNASATTTRDVEVVQAEVVARCSVEPTSLVAGQSVFIDARESTNGSYLHYDFDGNGEYDLFETTEFTQDHTYEEPGTYTPVIAVFGPAGGSDIAECETVTVEPQNVPPEASFTYSPRPGVAGQPITFDASGSVDGDGTIDVYRWDFDGDGLFETNTTDPTVERTYFQSGFQAVAVQVVDDDSAPGFTTRDVEVVEPTLRVECGVEPTTVAPGEDVTIFVEAGENASLFDYDLNGDGEFDVFETDEPTQTTSFDQPGTYTPLVRVYTGTGTREIFECGPVTVVEPNEPPTAAFTVDPAGPTTGKNVTFDGSNSTDSDGTITTYRWDFNGDGLIDRNTTGPTVTHSYASNGSYAPRLIVTDDDGASDETTRDLFVEQPNESDLPPWLPLPEVDMPPWWPIPAVGLPLLGLGGLFYHFYGGGGGGGGGDPKPKPKPRPQGSKLTGRYETGVFELPAQSGRLSVPVGFEPDLVMFSAANAARTDSATDRTAGWSRGVAHVTADGITNQCLTVADDAHSTDQATCAAEDDHALQIVRHEAEGPPGRVTVAVSDTTSDGFDVSVSIPGDDPLAGGIRVLFQAFRTGSNVDAEVGTLMTPTEPGTQTVELGIDAEHVSLSSSAAVADDDQLWTTDRGVGLSVGHAVAAPESPISQSVASTSAWPGRGHPTAAVCDDAEALHLLYQDGDTLAGRTSASVTGLGQTLRLQYDRVYNGPHKLGSIARHPISYLAMAGETMRPAVGTFSLPEPGENRTIDCGFEPELIEYRISSAPVGEELASGASPHPFGWSQGTAIATDDGLRQYVVHHAVAPRAPTERVTSLAADALDSTSTAATDGGETATPSARAGSSRDEVPGDDQPIEVPPAARSPDDERAGLWLTRDADGAIVGREELRVLGVTETGFSATVDRISTDQEATAGDRPTVVYRAWPAIDGSRIDGEAGVARTGDTDMTAESSQTAGRTDVDRAANTSEGDDGR